MRTSIPITRFDFHSLTFAEASTNRHFLGSKGILRYSLSSSNISDLQILEFPALCQNCVVPELLPISALFDS